MFAEYEQILDQSLSTSAQKPYGWHSTFHNAQLTHVSIAWKIAIAQIGILSLQNYYNYRMVKKDTESMIGKMDSCLGKMDSCISSMARIDSEEVEP